MINMFKNRRNPIGLDISDISVKMTQLHHTGERFVIQGFAEEKIPPGIIQADKIADPKALAGVIQKALDKPKYGKIMGPHVNASIPETRSFVRVIQMTAMTEDEAVEAVPWEAEAYIPVPISQVYLDWVILDPAKPNSPDKKMTVLITASPRDYVDNLLGSLKEAGLKPLAFEIESQATARSLVSRLNETVLIADISTARTGLIIYDKGTLQFTSSLAIAGSAMTESIAKGLSISMEDAEKRKLEIGIGDDDKVSLKKYLAPVLANLVTEIKNTIRFFEEHSGESGRINRLILTGGSSKLKHLPSFLLESFNRAAEEHPLRSIPGIKVELGNPWARVLKKGQTPPMSREDSLSYSTAIGLALRDIL